jgi:uncharacterized protein YecE (DUF72 family)
MGSGKKGIVKVGCSGFHYEHWKGPFYPGDLDERSFLDYYSKRFSTVELNVTFYRLPEREAFVKWYCDTPEDFIFSLKGSRFITHVKKLRSFEEPLEVFFSRVLLLREKLGPILWQLPPNLSYNRERFKAFLEGLRKYRVRNVFEFRHDSWIKKEVFQILEKENYAICMADWPDFLKELPPTADFVYIRRHGHGTYADCYSHDELKADARLINDFLKQKKDVYIYFNNDANGYAPKNALELMGLLKIKRPPVKKTICKPER